MWGNNNHITKERLFVAPSRPLLARMCLRFCVLCCFLTALLAGATAQAGTISVESATYGANCGIEADNDGASVKALCDGQALCRYSVNGLVLGDPKRGCAKNFVVHYICEGNPQTRTAVAGAEAGNGAIAALDCSDVPASRASTATQPVVSPLADDARIGFSAGGICLGACPPTQALQPGEDQAMPLAMPITLPNGDRFAITGQFRAVSLARSGQTWQIDYKAPFAIQYLGNAGGGASQNDTITATLYRGWTWDQARPLDLTPFHSAALSNGVAAGSGAEAGLSGSEGAQWIATQRWPEPPGSKQDTLWASHHYTIKATDGALRLWFRFAAHFAAGSAAGSFMALDGGSSPLLTVAQVRRGEGFPALPDFDCPASLPPDAMLYRASKAAVRSHEIMAMRCYLAAADAGHVGAIDDVGFALQQGITLVRNPREAEQWYRKAAEKGDTQAQDRLARLLIADGGAGLEEAKHWTQRADALRKARAQVCSAPSVVAGMYQADLAVSQDPQMRLGALIAAVSGTSVQYTVRPPFLVKVTDISIRNGPFQADPVSQAGGFLCLGFHLRGDDKVVPTLDRNDIADLRERRDAANYGSDQWLADDDAINNAELAGGISDFMNAQMKLHPIYAQYYAIAPIGPGRYRVTPVNTPVTTPHPVEVDGPAIDAGTP